MFDRPGLPRDDMSERSEADSRESDAWAVPVDHVVRKDGEPFAVLNATPSLALRTVAGFRRAAPSASWSVDRV